MRPGLAWERDHTGSTLDGNQDVSEVLSSFAPLPDGLRAGAASSGDTPGSAAPLGFFCSYACNAGQSGFLHPTAMMGGLDANGDG